MKYTSTIAAALLLLLSSCSKTNDYLCTVEQVTPTGVIYHTSATVVFTGTYFQMKAYEQAGTWSDTNTGAWQKITCEDHIRQ